MQHVVVATGQVRFESQAVRDRFLRAVALPVFGVYRIPNADNVDVYAGPDGVLTVQRQFPVNVTQVDLNDAWGAFLGFVRAREFEVDTIRRYVLALVHSTRDGAAVQTRISAFSEIAPVVAAHARRRKLL